MKITLLADASPKKKMKKDIPDNVMVTHSKGLSGYDSAMEKETMTPPQQVLQHAHMAHRGVVSDWVAGRASDHKMKQAHSRLKKIVKAKGQVK